MPTLPRSLHQRPPKRPKAIGWETHAALSTALARSIAHANVGHTPQAQHYARVLVGLLRDNGLLGDA